MAICGSYMFEFSVSKDMKQLKNNNNNDIIWEINEQKGVCVGGGIPKIASPVESMLHK
jgi:hypothetical protein